MSTRYVGITSDFLLNGASTSGTLGSRTEPTSNSSGVLVNQNNTGFNADRR